MNMTYITYILTKTARPHPPYIYIYIYIYFFAYTTVTHTLTWGYTLNPYALLDSNSRPQRRDTGAYHAYANHSIIPSTKNYFSEIWREQAIIKMAENGFGSNNGRRSMFFVCFLSFFFFFYLYLFSSFLFICITSFTAVSSNDFILFCF